MGSQSVPIQYPRFVGRCRTHDAAPKIRSNHQFTAQDLQMFGTFRVPESLLVEAGIKRVTTEGAVNLGIGRGKNGCRKDLGGLCFPILSVDGKPLNMRLRRDNPEIDAKGKEVDKYLSLPAPWERHLYMLPVDRKRLAEDPSVAVLMVESEKALLAITAALRRAKRDDLVPVAMGGCDGYLHKDRESGEPSAESVPIDDLNLLAKRTVYLMLDSNVATNPRVARAERRLVGHLRRLHARVTCLRLPLEVNGPDDFLAAYTDAAFWKLWDAPIEPWLADVGESYEQYCAVQPPEFLIKLFIPGDGITFFAGLSGHGKTFILLDVTYSLLTGRKLFGYCDVPTPVARVVYLTPEITLSNFKKRAELYGLGPYIKSGQLVVRTLSAYPLIDLVNPDLLLTVHNAVVILDTAVRFMKGDSNSASDNARGLGAAMLGLLAVGARAVVAAHHAPKNFRQADSMSLETVMADTRDLGAVCAAVWGVWQPPTPEAKNKTNIYIENVKSRDFTPPPPFLLKGRPFIDQGKGLLMDMPPGECPYMCDLKPAKPGRPRSAEKLERAVLLKEWLVQKKSPVEIHALLEARGCKIKRTTLDKELGDARRELKLGSVK